MEHLLERIAVPPIAGRDWRLTGVRNQDALVAGVRTDEDLAQFPYGLLLWASALGLAQTLADEPGTMAGKRVLELGCGIGLPGLVAAHLGASVVQTDYQELALDLARRNAADNDLGDVLQRRGDWRAWPDDLDAFDRVIASDVLYDRGLHAPLIALLPRLGSDILIADPIRPQALEALEAIEREGHWDVSLDSRLVEWDGARKEIALARLRRKGS